MKNLFSSSKDYQSFIKEYCSECERAEDPEGGECPHATAARMRKSRDDDAPVPGQESFFEDL